MSIKISDTELPGVLLIESETYRDDRGYFREIYHKDDFAAAGLNEIFLQDNISCSVRHVLRGLHYQLAKPQGKLVGALSGEIFDVAVDIRKGSPTFAKWIGLTLSEENNKRLYIPGGFAHGFCVMSEQARVFYKCTELYDRDDEHGLLWSDEDIGITWPISDPLISKKDKGLQTLSQIPHNLLPEYRI